MKKLTDKMNSFCEEYVRNGYNASAAYCFAYQNDNKDVCNTEGYRFLRDPRIVDRITEIEGDYKIVGHRIGIDRKFVLNKVKEMLESKKKVYDKEGNMIDEVPDYASINNGIDKWAKLAGEFSAEKKAIVIDDNTSPLGEGIDPSKLTKEEKEDLRKKILSELM